MSPDPNVGDPSALPAGLVPPVRRAAGRGQGIRWHLVQVLLVSIVPIGLFGAWLLYLHQEAQERERERSQIQVVRLLAATVDNALDSTVERLSILARLWESGPSPASDERIYMQARSALRTNADWSDVFAFRANGTGVFRASLPFGSDVPPLAQLDAWRPFFVEGRPVISNVTAAEPNGQLTVAVGVPALRAGKVVKILVAHLDLGWYDQLLTRQGLPDGGVAGVFDRNFKFVARSMEGDQRRGGDPTPEVIEDMKARREGVGRYVNLNGVAVYTAWTFTRHGWGVGSATPSAPIEEPFRRHLAVFGGVWGLLVLVGVLYAVTKARLVTTSLDSLAGQARNVAAGQRIENLPASGVAEVDGALSALEDASVLLQSATEERDRSLRTEQEARTAAEAANRAKDEFLAMLGHELRNPLAAITNAVAILGLPQRTEQHVEFVAGVIQRQSRQLAHIIDDLLDVGRVITGKISLTRAPLDLAESVRAVAGTLEASGRLRDRRVELDLSPAWIDGDQTRIQQIATNLLVNAATYTAAGGRIRVRVAPEGGEAVLQVSDDGRGIAREHLSRVFDLFFQAEATMDRTTGGLGIGLTLVQRLARLHGGEATGESDGPGRGATFTVRLPAIASPADSAPAAPPAPAEGGKTILVVDDNADGRDSLRVALELRGHRVLWATDGPEALALLERERPDVAVLDIGLPGMDGYDLARRIRERIGGGMALIALTGYGLERDAERALAAGFDRHLAKPVDPARLLQVIDTLTPVGRAAS